ncbi:2-succinyl-5-enolpyruvyl-6-hydroxy-3-cyclohexene-1-carboxylic-acid synthase [Salinarchaeum laminariae]|uniref:2-succinyl-5-enolpyruvyl-6-hydroxy-3- cyclohexene-1-carboxylic-acid synthase n=1 Tax=Salinarchaeum laminariae TaxID=869888 RepID=UPI0020C0543E|nr:2-succinyl-5-enolpyruvyl-6-hydroxy-3-cyclohexene-1-carboxylic-acid synthase [Salinarchaeum laminariae]
MTAPNRNTLWAEILVDELVANGLDAVCIAPGSRSTPLTVAAYDHDELTVFSHLDERSASYFALGRARRTGRPLGLICTSGTAAANFHPAVIEASQARVPLVLLTADRPPELRDSGANQTVDQTKLYGDAVRWFRELPEPEPTDRKLRRLRVDAARAVASASGSPAGPVHLNVPFRKPLEPIEVEGDDPKDPDGLGVSGRDGPFVDTDDGSHRPSQDRIDALADRIAESDRVLFVAGPADPVVEGAGGQRSAGGQQSSDGTRSVNAGEHHTGISSGNSIRSAAAAAGAPVLADPLSGARFGPGPESAASDEPALVCGGYDAYVGSDAVAEWPEPSVVVRTGASPTSKALRTYLGETDAYQVLIDPAGEWREATFSASAVLRADPPLAFDALEASLRDRGVDPTGSGRVRYRERFAAAESEHWSVLADARDDEPFEGAVVPAVLDSLPQEATVFASNSMPVRDLDRFGAPDDRRIGALANRGASGIDGIVSSALGAASGGAEPLVGILGDLAFYHDMNGLLAAGRCDLDATLVVVNNDGGGIFHALPIESFEPPFTEAFKTPHGLEFEPTAELYDLGYERVKSLDALQTACSSSIGRDGVDVIELRFDAASSHRTRESLAAELDSILAESARP